MGKENVNSPDDASTHEAPVAVKNGVYTGNYGNRFAVVNVNLGGYRFRLHADHTGFYPHIKVKDQKEVLNRVIDELVDCINKGAAALSEPPRNCDRFEPRTADDVKAIIDEWRASARAMNYDSFYAFTRWLFAIATEKGDNHAKND